MEFSKQRHRRQFIASSQLGAATAANLNKGADFDGSALNADDDDDNLLLNSSQATLHTTNSQQSKEQQQNNRTTDAQTMMHILKANIGTGVLAMPNAFKNVGLWPGFILVPIIGAICIHCMNILIACHNHLCDRFNYESLDYDQVAALALACGPKFARRLAKRAHFVVTVFLIFTQVGFCCVYIMFVVENLQLVVLNLFNVEYSNTTYLLLVFPIIGLTSCTSNLKHLARISTFANVLQLVGLGLIFFDLLQFHTYSSTLQTQIELQQEQQLTQQQAYFNAALTASMNESAQSLSTTTAMMTTNNETHLLLLQQQQQPIASGLQQAPLSHKAPIAADPVASRDIFAGLPLFFATAVYAFEGIGVVLPLIKEMQHPARISGLNGVLNTSMSMVAILYMATGFFGYSKYGQFVQGSITLNLPETTLNEIVRFIFAIAIGLSYSLQFYVPWTIMWPHIDESLFYSYRPREPRDKLEILNKLSKENEWAIDESEWQYQSSAKQQQQQQTSRRAGGNLQSCDEKQAIDEATQLQQQQLLLDQNSTASTFATSYTMSTCVPVGQQLQQSSKTSKPLNLSLSLVHGGANQYGSISASTGFQSQQQQARATKLQRHRRDRLEDVMERELEDSIPEVQWRPPPRSMRGKRKLVRYTVILVSVSFTFVAAALIPRLDLFISLIGALASSSLAIIFPAIIQLCTFWDFTQDNHDDNDNDDDNNNDVVDKAKGESFAIMRGSNGRDSDIKHYRRRKLIWLLFIFKNSFLIVFGILGLITGSWVSISQLGAVYMGIDGAET